MRIELDPRKTVASVRQRWQSSKRRRMLRHFDFGGCKRMYLYHIRKTAGTSLIKSLMSLNGSDGEAAFTTLANNSDQSLVANDMIYAGWVKSLIETGDYSFGFSHHSYDEIELPSSTFRFTCLRNPAERVISHYRMLKDFSLQPKPHECFVTEGAWLGNSFDDFLDRTPRQHLLNQLYMFSNSYSIDEAVSRICSLEHVLFVEDYSKGVAALGRKTGLAIRDRHDRRSKQKIQISKDSKSRLNEMMQDEFDLLAAVREQLGR